ncbi:uncharacterized protein TM35_000034410 [Trypanosoma theileri]|uniref:Uncharacterized protein n=1 Tax=Trypanosoma theileri TaxID=67003 RepID=A0A1X0P741_9TRYP|nr:uncharacterized protein TM35_000034410 [Trypanosoma theileri]ORC92688.1 hypothetical protein TM35_000034410 [Trypanosoma theileri]
MLRQVTILLLPRKVSLLYTRRLVPQRQVIPTRHPLRRGALLLELDKPSQDDVKAMMKKEDNGNMTNGEEEYDKKNKKRLISTYHVSSSDVALPSSSNSSTSSHSGVSNTYLVPSHYANKVEKAALHVDKLAQGSFSHTNTVSSNSRVRQRTSMETLQTQDSILREMFNDANKRCIQLRKDTVSLQEERRAFRLSHGRTPTKTEVSPTVHIPLAPVAALKLTKYFSPHASAREAVQHALRLQQHVATNALRRSGEKTLFRCLRCFHVYTARPSTLLRDGTEPPSVQRWRKCSVGKRRDALVRNPNCCPSCGSKKAQWMMEYVHYRTHG